MTSFEIAFISRNRLLALIVVGFEGCDAAIENFVGKLGHVLEVLLRRSESASCFGTQERYVDQLAANLALAQKGTASSAQLVTAAVFLLDMHCNR